MYTLSLASLAFNEISFTYQKKKKKNVSNQLTLRLMAISAPFAISSQWVQIIGIHEQWALNEPKTSSNIGFNTMTDY